MPYVIKLINKDVYYTKTHYESEGYWNRDINKAHIYKTKRAALCKDEEFLEIEIIIK